MTTNSNKPTISVIITNYNHKTFLEEAYCSIQDKQTCSDICEIIIVDDCSTDGSQELIKEIENHASPSNSRFPVKTIFLKENKGKWNALNVAISQAQGALITLQDADDVSCPTRIERQLRCLIENKSLHNLCLFHHCWSQEDIDKNKVQVFSENHFPVMGHAQTTQNVYQGFKTPGINHYYIGPQYEAHGATCLFYKQLWENGMKFLPGNLGLRCQRAEDSDFNTKMTLLLQKTSILLEPQYCYRRNTSTNPAWLENL